jgi:hypothetical protein
MARWKLTEAHYLKVPGTRWEYSEVDRISGKLKRAQFDVPLYLDPKEPSDWTVRHSAEIGDIIVTDGKNAQPKDIIFEGSPTPGMLPLDPEAQEISSKFSWNITMGLDDISQSESNTNQILNGLLDKLVEASAKASDVAQTVKIEGLEQMMAAMTKMMEQNQLLLTKVLGDHGRRVPG